MDKTTGVFVFSENKTGTFVTVLAHSELLMRAKDTQVVIRFN